MLSQTGTVSLKGVQEMEKALTMIDKMKAKYTPEIKKLARLINRDLTGWNK